MRHLGGQTTEAVDAIRRHWNRQPRVALVLGTGMSNLSELIEKEDIVPYSQIPHFPTCKALGHTGQLVMGSLQKVVVVAMQGRCHYYEGYSMQQITLPVRVMRALGAEVLILSNAAGGLNSQYRTGDIVVIEDHLNWMGDNPLRGSRSPLRLEAMYDRHLISRALDIARTEKFRAHRGVYVGMSGPNYETPAEYRWLRGLGGDVVGMSTVPEAIVAAHLGMRVLGLSVVTNVCHTDLIEPTSGQQVVLTATTAESKLSRIVQGILADLALGFSTDHS